MSASNKKKLRNALEADKLTEKQRTEQKEAKKLKAYTIAFVVVLVALIAAAVFAAVSRNSSNIGKKERQTVAMTVGQQELSNADLNYFYVDTINNFYSQNKDFLSLYGLKTGVALKDQYMDEAAEITWADYFLTSAKQNAQGTYALAAEAHESGFEVSESIKQQVDSAVSMVAQYGSILGYGNADGYLRAMYGTGANTETYRKYVETSLYAGEYSNSYMSNLSCTDEEIQAEDSAHVGAFDGYGYHYYYIPVSAFDGDDAAAQAEAAAAGLTGEDITSFEDFDAAIAALSINEGKDVASTYSTANQLSSANTFLQEWLASAQSKAGSTTYVSVKAGEDAEVTGFYAAYLDSVNNNRFPLVNVRHILVSMEGGTTENGVTTYSDDEKVAALAKAEDILAQWKNGEATEASFAKLAEENTSDTASLENGGLYENVYPGQMVASFNDWCFDSNRNVGDTGIVESSYGYHIIYFSGFANETFRDYLIRSQITSEKSEQWYQEVIEKNPVNDLDFSYIRTDLVLNAQ